MAEESTEYLDLIFVRMEAEIREKIAKKIESEYIMHTITKHEEGYDDGLKRAVDIARGKDNG